MQQLYADGSKMHQSTVSRIVKQISRILARKARDFSRWMNEEEAERNKINFRRIANFPNVIGLIDCTHIRVRVRKVAQEQFRNRKNTTSINCQAIIDSDMRFVNFIARWPGVTHDQRIFENSRVYVQLTENRFGGYLLGDGGYGIRPFMMIPLRNSGNLNHAERRYQKAHIKTRNMIERTFGAFKSKFQCLMYELRTSLDTSLAIIMACVMLWNFIKDNGEADEEQQDDVPQENERDLEPLPEARNETEEGTIIRRRLVERFFA